MDVPRLLDRVGAVDRLVKSWTCVGA
jgi:hypothetical protein